MEEKDGWGRGSSRRGQAGRGRWGAVGASAATRTLLAQRHQVLVAPISNSRERSSEWLSVRRHPLPPHAPHTGQLDRGGSLEPYIHCPPLPAKFQEL